MTRDENDRNAPHLKINEVVLIHGNSANKDYQQDSRFLYILVPNKSLSITRYFSEKKYVLKIFSLRISTYWGMGYWSKILNHYRKKTK